MVFVVHGIVVAIDIGFVVACLVVWFSDGSTNNVVISCVVEEYLLHGRILFVWLEQLGPMFYHKSVPLILSEGEKVCCHLPVPHGSKLLETGSLVNSDIVDVIVAWQVGGIDGKEQGKIMKEQGYNVFYLVVAVALECA